MALRTPLSVTPHLYMGDSTGRPLDKGVVYFGEQDKDPEFYPINLFSDDALTKPLAQPVHTKGGYLYDKGDMVEPHAKELIYSVKVLDSYGRKVFYKGAMMRNSWNDDVIEQINTAIIGSADAARQVAIDITNDAINNTAVEGGVLADTFVTVTANGAGQVARNQRDKNADVISVKDFGAKGNGQSFDKAAFQTAIDKLSAIYIATRVPQTLHVPDGIYLLHSVHLKAGVNIVGSEGAVLKKPDAADEPESTRKWWRMLTTDGTVRDPYTPKHRIVISGLTFDGNMSGSKWTGGYSQEQAHCLFLSQPNSVTTNVEDRAAFHVENCHFRDNVADGLSSNVNTDLTFSNISAYNCFRGGLVATGGNSIVRGSNYKGIGARIDVEVDGKGYDGNYSMEYDLDSIESLPLESLDGRDGADLGGIGFGGRGVLRNSRIVGKSINLHNTSPQKAEFYNCAFETMADSGSDNNRMYGANFLFYNCVFKSLYAPDRTNRGFLTVYPRLPSSEHLDDKYSLKLVNCKAFIDTEFQAHSEVAEESFLKVWAVPSNTGATREQILTIELDNVDVGEGFSGVVDLNQGGYITAKDITYRGYGYVIRLSQSLNRPFGLDVVGYIKADRANSVIASRTGTYQDGSYVNFHNCWFDPYKIGADVLKSNILGRLNYMVDKPTREGYVPLQTVLHKYNLQKEPQYASHTIPHNGALSWMPRAGVASAKYRTLWAVASQLQLSGSTSDRPQDLQDHDYGLKFYDDDLGCEIWWNGSNWVAPTS